MRIALSEVLPEDFLGSFEFRGMNDDPIPANSRSVVWGDAIDILIEDQTIDAAAFEQTPDEYLLAVMHCDKYDLIGFQSGPASSFYFGALGLTGLAPWRRTLLRITGFPGSFPLGKAVSS